MWRQANTLHEAPQFRHAAPCALFRAKHVCMDHFKRFTSNVERPAPVCDRPPCVLRAGDPVHRGGLQAAGAHGLPRGSAPADGSLLAEGAQQTASLPRYPQLPGQAHPQPQQPPDAGGGCAQVELQPPPHYRGSTHNECLDV